MGEILLFYTERVRRFTCLLFNGNIYEEYVVKGRRSSTMDGFTGSNHRLRIFNHIDIGFLPFVPMIIGDEPISFPTSQPHKDSERLAWIEFYSALEKTIQISLDFCQGISD